MQHDNALTATAKAGVVQTSIVAATITKHTQNEQKQQNRLTRYQAHI